MQNKIYEGRPGGQVLVSNGGGHFSGKPLNKCLDLASHSPTGFSWGYLGSGPAQLALAIMVEEYGDDLEDHPVHYQDLKVAVIAKLDQSRGWTLTSEQIRGAVQDLVERNQDNAGTAPIRNQSGAVQVSLELEDAQAMALAQFVKRAGWHEFRENAVDDQEAYQIRAAVEALQDALAAAGYAPR